MTILGVDIGTTCMKMAVFTSAGERLDQHAQFKRDYAISTYNDGLYSDIDQTKWQDAFAAGCTAMAGHMDAVDVIALSGTTPGLSAMAADGTPLYPAILMLDQRSRAQADRIIAAIGLKTLLDETGNMPVAGGCSLASILWLKDTHPEIFAKTAVFGHSNTVMGAWLTGAAAIDPSSASLTALYNTARNDLTWNDGIAGEFGITTDRLPRLMHSWDSPGRVKHDLAARFGLAKEPPVVIGGNDAVLGAYSVGVDSPGEIMNVNGTCEITLVCLPRCLSSTRYNVRAHVLPGRWLTLHVMNAGGKAFEWFRGVFCSEMDRGAFFGDFVPTAVGDWLDRDSGVTYVPYLMGSRYSLLPLKGGFTGLTPETTRDEILAAMVRGLASYQREHLKDIGMEVPLDDTIHVTGGAAAHPVMIRAKERWLRDCAYVHEDESSVRGAAMLGRLFLEGPKNR